MYESGFALNDLSKYVAPINPVAYEKCELNSYKIIIYDLETTGLSFQDEIVKIAATPFHHDEKENFNVYVIPLKSFSKKATEITGLHVFQGDLYLHKNLVESVTARNACNEFLKYLKSFQCDIILLAHNGYVFDNSRLTKLINDVGLIEEFNVTVKGFVDSLPLFKKILPDRNKEKGKSFSISALMTDYLPSISSASLHNAVDDVKVLRELLHTLVKDEELIKNNPKSIFDITNEKKAKDLTVMNKLSLVEFKDKLSSKIINKMTVSGISKSSMKDVFEKNGKDGLRQLFCESVMGKYELQQTKKY